MARGSGRDAGQSGRASRVGGSAGNLDDPGARALLAMRRNYHAWRLRLWYSNARVTCDSSRVRQLGINVLRQSVERGPNRYYEESEHLVRITEHGILYCKLNCHSSAKLRCNR